MAICKFCGKEINALKWNGNPRDYNCSDCVKYCMEKCEFALKTDTSWHTEPCVSCEHNPYAKQYVFRGGEWKKEKK